MSEIVNQLVLRDGRIIDLTAKQQNSLAYTYLVTTDIENQKVKVDKETFQLKDIMTEQEKQERGKEQYKEAQTGLDI